MGRLSQEGVKDLTVRRSKTGRRGLVIGRRGTCIPIFELLVAAALFTAGARGTHDLTQVCFTTMSETGQIAGNIVGSLVAIIFARKSYGFTFCIYKIPTK